MSRSAVLDPLVLRQIRQLNEYPAGEELASEFVFALEEAIANITKDDMTTKLGAGGLLEQMSGLSQALRKAKFVANQCQSLADQANEIVVRWWNAGMGPISRGDDFLPLVLDGRKKWHVAADSADNEKSG